MKIGACRFPGNTGELLPGNRPRKPETGLLPGRAAALAAEIRADPPGYRRRLTRSDCTKIVAALDVVGGARSEAAIRLARRLDASRSAFTPPS